MTKTYTVTVEYDPITDDYVLPFPDEMLNELGWEIGDTLHWSVEGNTIILSKQTK